MSVSSEPAKMREQLYEPKPKERPTRESRQRDAASFMNAMQQAG